MDKSADNITDFFKHMNRPTPYKDQGRVLFDIRVSRDGYMNMRDMSQALSLDAGKLSDIERGVIAADWDQMARLYRAAMANRI